MWGDKGEGSMTDSQNSDAIDMRYDASSLAIVIVNYNSWSDLIECIESIYSSNSSGFKVIVCDNASADQSVEKLLDWVDGKLDVSFDGPQKTEGCVDKKPENYLHIAADGLRKGDEVSSLIVMETGGNLGFAGGNNVGLRYGLDHSDCEYFWLLNADTTIQSDTIEHLVNRMKEDPEIGLCGTIIRFYHFPQTLQALGGATFNKWTGNSTGIASHTAYPQVFDRDEVEAKTGFIVGASLCTTRTFLDDIGLMEERYFLYYEEIDWSTRNNGKYRHGLADKAEIFHKEGGAIGTSSVPGQRGAVSEYYLISSKLAFTGRFFPLAFIPVYLSSVIMLLKRLMQTRLQNAKALFKALTFRRL
jgi:GT2 family glycosyltransferase